MLRCASSVWGEVGKARLTGKLNGLCSGMDSMPAGEGFQFSLYGGLYTKGNPVKTPCPAVFEQGKQRSGRVCLH